jgi:hypothetical protein
MAEADGHRSAAESLHQRAAKLDPRLRDVDPSVTGTPGGPGYQGEPGDGQPYPPEGPNR